MQDINKMYPEIVRRLKEKSAGPWTYSEVSNMFAKYFSITNPKTIRSHVERMSSEDFGYLHCSIGNVPGKNDKFTVGEIY